MRRAAKTPGSNARQPEGSDSEFLIKYGPQMRPRETNRRSKALKQAIVPERAFAGVREPVRGVVRPVHVEVQARLVAQEMVSRHLGRQVLIQEQKLAGRRAPTTVWMELSGAAYKRARGHNASSPG